MRVRELFAKADFQKIARDLAYRSYDIEIDDRKSEEEKNNEREALRIHIEECYQKMLANNQDCPDSDSVIVCTKCVDLFDSTECMDASRYDLEDLKKEIYVADYDDPESGYIPQEEFEQRYIQGYAFEFSPWSEILGSHVADISIQEYGLDEVAEAIYDEMTFFGYDPDFRDEKANEEMDTLTEQIDEIEEHPERLISWDSIKEGLGLEPETPEEEEERDRNTRERMKINQKESVRILEAVKREFYP